jgi:hypothetical protein
MLLGRGLGRIPRSLCFRCLFSSLCGRQLPDGAFLSGPGLGVSLYRTLISSHPAGQVTSLRPYSQGVAKAEAGWEPGSPAPGASWVGKLTWLLPGAPVLDLSR